MVDFNVKIKLMIFVGLISFTSGCNQGLKSLNSVGNTLEIQEAPQDPQFTISDIQTQSLQHTNSTAIAVHISNDSSVVKWCASPLQSTRPADAGNCIGGAGPTSSNGWLMKAPTQMNLPAADGVKTIYLWVANAAGQTNNNQVSKSILLDTTAPTLANLQPVNFTSPTNSLSNTLKFDASDSGSGILSTTCQLDQNQAAPCSLTVTYASLADGNHTLNVASKDNAGNTSAPLQMNWLVDRTLPITTIFAGPSATTNQTTASFDFGANENGSGLRDFQCKLDSGTFASCTSPKTFASLSEGVHVFSVYSVDKAGNQSATVTHNWQIDLTAPTVTITSAPANFINVTTASFQFSGSNGVANFQCRIDNAAFANCTSPKSYSSLAEGSHTFEVLGSDLAGNQSAPASSSFNVDTTAPNLNLTGVPSNPTPSTTATFSFSASDSGSGIDKTTCQINKGGFQNCSSPVTYSSLNLGAQSFDVNVTDKIGNISSKSFTWNIQTASCEFYISSTGNDANSGGSPATSWKSINRVNAQPLAPGCKVYFEGGQIFQGKLYFDSNRGGTSTQPILVTSFGTGRATIDSGTERAFDVYNTGGIHIINLNIKGAGANQGNESGLHFFNGLTGNVKLANIKIDQVSITGYYDSGVKIGSYSGSSGFSNFTITNSSISNNGEAGILSYGYPDANNAHSNFYIARNRVFDNFGHAGTQYASGSGITLGGVDGALIEYNVVYNNGKNNATVSGYGGPVGIWTWMCNAIVIQYNESYGNKTNSLTDGGGFDFDGGTTNSVLQYNYSHDNDGPGISLVTYGSTTNSNNIIRYNVSENDGRKNNPGAIGIFGADVNSEIYNNTIFSSNVGNAALVRFDSWWGSNIRFRNNIFISANNQPLVWGVNKPGLIFQNNIYWAMGNALSIVLDGKTYSSLSAFQTAGFEKVNGVAVGGFIDPQLNQPGGGAIIGDATQLGNLTAYKLRASSPLIDGGLDLQKLFGINIGTRDFYGNGVPRGPASDIGAHEY